ncbi:hypothetical protein IQ249_12085 [Lusitaniella coriacea LEGE 07157]|uniref:DUF697 domain-containing protein n=1 Tax=Lusitaniella coriacea LEGE 07157 TaxID=945747 RepID=A0A8J7JB36_9CYAN|nr:hypothetical protein [Lusitaniella coriacea]MBE9116640.1 hypothetical protein [Lusitaniella coriacea LEGE 07157]
MSKLDDMLLEQATKLLEAMDKTVDNNLPQEIAEIVKFHSKGAALSALGSAWIPGAGGAAATVACAGFIWTMYSRIGLEIDLPFSKNILKSLASGVATNIASYVVGMIALSTAFSFVPGLGNIGASVIMGGVCYAMTLASGYVYLKIMTQLFSKGIDPTTLSEQELKNIAKDVVSDSDVKDVIRGAKAEFKAKEEKGEFK